MQGPDMRTARGNHGCFSVKKNGRVAKVYVFGGYPGPLSSTEVLNVSELTWSKGPDLLIGLNGNDGAESFHDDFSGFSVGGLGHAKYLKTIFGLQKTAGTERWVQVQSMTEARQFQTVVNNPSSLPPFC